MTTSLFGDFFAIVVVPSLQEAKASAVSPNAQLSTPDPIGTVATTLPLRHRASPSCCDNRQQAMIPHRAQCHLVLHQARPASATTSWFDVLIATTSRLDITIDTSRCAMTAAT
jgi:hypothetical protein